jgi:hypothetical protein
MRSLLSLHGGFYITVKLSISKKSSTEKSYELKEKRFLPSVEMTIMFILQHPPSRDQNNRQDNEIPAFAGMTNEM